jgi:archaellum component FlaC
MIPVKGYSELYRDENSNAILNCSDIEYNEYLKVKNIIINQKKEIDTIKNDIEEIKLLLQSLVN